MKKFTKAFVATFLVASMILGVTGCSKEGNFTAKKFQSVALDDLEAVEYTYDDFDIDFSDSDEVEELGEDIVSDIQDGIFLQVTGEEILDNDFMDEDMYDILTAILDIDLDYEDIDTVSTYVRGDVDKDEGYIISGSLMEFTDKDAAADYYASMINNDERLIKITNAVVGSEIDLDELGKDYFSYNGSNSGHLVIKLSTEDMDIDELDDLEVDVTVVLGFYIEGKDVLAVVSASTDSEGCDEVNEFFDALKMKNPYELESTEAISEVIEDIANDPDAIAERWMDKVQDSKLGEIR